jgi:hypothetical protein
MMRTAVTLLVLASLLAGCASRPMGADLHSLAIVPSPYEPAAQFDPDAKLGNNAGAVVGAAGGAGIGAISAQASAGLLCTIGGPLCLIVMIPAAIIGGLIGGVTGGVVDAVTADPGNRIANARDTIQQAIADMRLTDALAAQTSRQANLPLKRTAQSEAFALEVGMSDLQILPREKEMALVLRARSRLYRISDGQLLDERVSEAQTDFRKYTDWAADDAQPLRRAVDAAVAELSRSIVSEHLGSRPRSDISERPGG